MPGFNLKVQVRVRVKRGVWARYGDQGGQVKAAMSGWQRNPAGPCPFIRPSGQDPEQSRGAEKPQISCPLAGIHRHWGRGRNEEEMEEK